MRQVSSGPVGATCFLKGTLAPDMLGDRNNLEKAMTVTMERTATYNPTDRLDSPYLSQHVPSEDSLRSKDMVGLIVAAIITLGPLAATAIFAH